MTEKRQMKKNQASSCTIKANIKHVCHEVEMPNKRLKLLNDQLSRLGLAVCHHEKELVAQLVVEIGNHLMNHPVPGKFTRDLDLVDKHYSKRVKELLIFICIIWRHIKAKPQTEILWRFVHTNQTWLYKLGDPRSWLTKYLRFKIKEVESRMCVSIWDLQHFLNFDGEIAQFKRTHDINLQCPQLEIPSRPAQLKKKRKKPCRPMIRVEEHSHDFKRGMRSVNDICLWYFETKCDWEDPFAESSYLIYGPVPHELMTDKERSNLEKITISDFLNTVNSTQEISSGATTHCDDLSSVTFSLEEDQFDFVNVSDVESVISISCSI